jgi:hypothetical protein
MENLDRSREPRRLAEWLERYRRLWDERFQKLDDYLHHLQHEESTNGRPG